MAMLYLVTEELLVEAHEAENSLFSAAFFFVGFWLFILFKEATLAA